MGPEDLKVSLRKRVYEFGEKTAYVIYPEEFAVGLEHNLFHVLSQEDRGDGTIVTKMTFEGKMFLCFTEKD
ncbi:MAG TPA: hypothetical protein DCS23_00215 [Candidatus Yonathbacteria bacterium]|nr:hypothetical protein [Candidatus Yonathbacteria bacterium]